MTAFLILMVLWFFAYIAALIWLVAIKGHLIGGGMALFALSLVPMMYGRWTTPSDWHDSPLMGVYYLPTALAASLSLIIVFVGLVLKTRQAFLTRRGDQ